MKGIHSIEVISRNLRYQITLTRNITVIAGDSGTGKSSFRKFIQDYVRLHGKVSYTINSTAPFKAYNGAWEDDSASIKNQQNSIIVIDEDADYLRTKHFAELVETSSNYFVLITRIPLPMLPYSYACVYTLRTIRESDTYITTNQELESTFSEGV